MLLKIVDSQSVSRHPSILEAAMESSGDHSDLAKEVTERMIAYLKKNPGKMLQVFDHIRGLCNIDGTIKQKDGKIYLEKSE